MSDDELEHGNPDREPSRGSNGSTAEPRPVEGTESNQPEEALHGNGVEEREPETRQRRRTDPQEENLVAFIRQEVQQTAHYYFEAQPQLHSPEALAKYKDIDPDFPNRLLAMAEKEQQAHIDADLIPIKAESYGFRFAVTAASLFPLAVFVFGVILIVTGNDIAGYIAAAVGVFGGGAAMIANARPRRQGRSGQNETPQQQNN